MAPRKVTFFRVGGGGRLGMAHKMTLVPVGGGGGLRTARIGGDVGRASGRNEPRRPRHAL